MIAVPKLLQIVPIVNTCSGDGLVQPFVAAAHDEDAENAGDILSHLLPLEPSCELFDQYVRNVEGGPCLEKFLRSVLHLYEDGFATLRGAK